MVIKAIGVLVLGVVVAVGFRFFRLGQQSREMRPELGMSMGRLRGCGPKPNCVSSAAEPGTERFVEPLAFEGSRLEAKNRVIDFVTGRLGGQLVSDEEDYLHFEVSTALFKFVDDLEFHFPDSIVEKIAVRSASRVGTSDFGANRKRVEKLRQALKNESAPDSSI